jgi:hypothetical protein
MAKGHASLAPEKRNIAVELQKVSADFPTLFTGLFGRLLRRDGFRRMAPFQKPVLKRIALKHMTGENFMHCFPIDQLILYRGGIGQADGHDRFTTASTRATGSMEKDILTTGGGDVFSKFVEHLNRPGGVFAGSRADLDKDRLLGKGGEEFFLGPLDASIVLFLDLFAHSFEIHWVIWKK